MIRRTWDRDKWLLTPQAEHARLAGLIAAMWNYPGDKPREEVITAIRRHDDGWTSLDENTTVSGAGAPVAFNDEDLNRSTQAWVDSAAALEAEGKPYEACLVAAHFLKFAEQDINLGNISVRSAIAVGNFIGKQRAIMTRCEKAAGMPLEEEPEAREAWQKSFREHLRFLQVCDTISLLLCTDFKGEHEIKDVPFLPDGDTLSISRKSDNLTLNLSPLPFKKNLRDHLTCFVIPRRVYESTEELQNTIRSTKPMVSEVHLGS